MIDTQTKGTDGLTDIEINSQATNFMANGQDTISTTLTACLYELSKHRDYQNKVYEEVCQISIVLKNALNPFVPNAPFLCPLKTSEMVRFCDVFRG